MTRATLLIAVLASGCMIVPAKKISTTPGAREYGAVTFGKPGAIELRPRAEDSAIQIHAIRHGECSRSVFTTSEVTTEKHAKLGGSDDPRAQFFGIFVAPVLIPISALVTGLIVAADTAETKKETKLAGTEQYACTVVAENLAVTMTLPTGAVVQGITDRTGDVTLDVPSSEPYLGDVKIAATGAETRQVSYARPRPAFTVARDVVTECAAQHAVTGHVDIKLSINAAGFATRVWLSAGDSRFNACVGQRLAGVRFPAKTHDKTIKMPLALAATL